MLELIRQNKGMASLRMANQVCQGPRGLRDQRQPWQIVQASSKVRTRKTENLSDMDWGGGRVGTSGKGFGVGRNLPDENGSECNHTDCHINPHIYFECHRLLCQRGSEKHLRWSKSAGIPRTCTEQRLTF